MGYSMKQNGIDAVDIKKKAAAMNIKITADNEIEYCKKLCYYYIMAHQDLLEDALKHSVNYDAKNIADYDKFIEAFCWGFCVAVVCIMDGKLNIQYTEEKERMDEHGKQQ